MAHETAKVTDTLTEERTTHADMNKDLREALSPHELLWERSTHRENRKMMVRACDILQCHELSEPLHSLSPART